MAKKSSKKSTKKTTTKRSSPAKNVFLALTLVPFVVGVIFIGAWVLDLEVLDTPQSQVTVGIFFFLISFVASNAIQKRWRLAAGWGLLAVADIVTLVWLNVAAQIVALSIGLIGVILLGIEFYSQFQQNKLDKAKK